MQTSTKNIRKKAGIFYTPENLTSSITKIAISNYILDLFNNQFNGLDDIFTCGSAADLKKFKDSLWNLKILDPACGEGAFLIQSAEFLLRLRQKYRKARVENCNLLVEKAEIIRDNIYGVDLFEETIQKCARNLEIWLNCKDLFNHNIKVGNSLIGSINGEKLEGDKINQKLPKSWKIFNWREEFNEILTNDGFDIILENPPYVFTRGKNFSSQLKEYYQNYVEKKGIFRIKKSKAIQSGKLNTYSLFLVRSLDLLKNGGKLAAIIPNTFLRSINLDIYRKYILENNRIRRIINLPNGVFSNVVASLICVIIDKKKPIKKNFTEIFVDIEDISKNNSKSILRAQSSFLRNKSYLLNIALTEYGSKICKIIEQDSIKLGDICRYIIEGIICSKKRDVFEDRLQKADKPFLEGKNIGRFITKWDGKFIRYKKERLHRARPEEVFTNKKLMMQRISGGAKPIKANYDPGIFYTFSSINNLLIKKEFQDKIPLKFILMLLNSNLINWYYANNYSNKSDLTVNISKTFLEEIPIKIVKECTVFTQIADHLMFLFRYYNIESENAASYYKMLQYFLNLGSAIVYELYFMKFIKTRLTEIIENCLIPINFNEWAIQKLKIRQVLRKKKHLEELEEKNLRIIRDNYNQLIRNDELWKNLDRINNHEFVKYIEGGF